MDSLKPTVKFFLHIAIMAQSKVCGETKSKHGGQGSTKFIGVMSVTVKQPHSSWGNQIFSFGCQMAVSLLPLCESKLKMSQWSTFSLFSKFIMRFRMNNTKCTQTHHLHKEFTATCKRLSLIWNQHCKVISGSKKPQTNKKNSCLNNPWGVSSAEEDGLK